LAYFDITHRNATTLFTPRERESLRKKKMRICLPVPFSGMPGEGKEVKYLAAHFRKG